MTPEESPKEDLLVKALHQRAPLKKTIQLKKSQKDGLPQMLTHIDSN